MIYFDPMSLGPQSLINTWLKYEMPAYIDPNQVAIIRLLMDWLLEVCLDFVVDKCEQFVFCSKMHLAMSFFKLFSSMLHDV